MRLLLDECLPVDLRLSLAPHEAHTVRWAGFEGMKNGVLLRAAVRANYQVFVTVDQGIPYQQSEALQNLILVLLRAPTNQLEDLVPLVPELLKSLEEAVPGAVILVGPLPSLRT